VEVLARSSAFDLDDAKHLSAEDLAKNTRYVEHVLTTEDVRALCKDLKVSAGV